MKAAQFKICIVRSCFNPDITLGMQKGALQALQAGGVSSGQVTVYEVPGAFEIPALVKIALASKKFHGVLALGAVIRGETQHHYFISHAVTQALMDMTLHSAVPLAYGVITPENDRQAQARSLGALKNNKGWQAAEALLSQMALYGKLKIASAHQAKLGK